MTWRDLSSALELTMDFGGHRDSSSSSGPTILAAIIPTTAIAIVYLTIFVIIRPWYRKIYAPRTFLETIPEKDRTPTASRSRFQFFKDYYLKLGDKFILQHSSLDAYLYLRFLRLIVYICLLGTCLTWPILIPVNFSGKGDSKQLDRLSFSNINRNDILWAHVVVAWVFLSLVTAIIIRERLRLIGVRQAFHFNETVANKLSSRTVLFLNVPRENLAHENLQATFGEDAYKSWPVPKIDKLEGLVEQRRDLLRRLETAQVELSQTAAKARERKQRAGHGTDSDTEINNIVPKEHRPRHRPKLVNHSVDTIDFAREKTQELSKEISALQNEDDPKTLSETESAIFVAYKTQAAAHSACELVRFSTILPVEHRYLHVLPEQVHWQNLTRSSSDRTWRAFFALIFVIAFTIFFSIPAGLVATLSNVGYLSEHVEWLGFINDLPDIVFSLLQGLLPPFLVSWFVSYVPKLFRHVANLSGEPTKVQAELKTQAWFFTFSVIQVFLITTFSSGAAAVVYKIIRDPGNAPHLLAESVPTASNFYMTYFILQGTASAADSILNYQDLLEYLFYDRFWTRTPRDKYEVFVDMKGIPYGKLYPKFTNLFVIALAYACIAPLVIGFATVGFVLYYACYKHQFLYVCKSKLKTRGEMYKRALQQMTTGVYLAEVCLLGLFGARKGFAQTTCIIALLVTTALVNAATDRMLGPLEAFLGVDSWQRTFRAGRGSSGEAAPLLANDNEGPDDDQDEAAASIAASHARRLGFHILPDSIATPLSNLVENTISSSRDQITSWLRDPAADLSDEAITLSEDETNKAYLHPALTANPPVVWLARDQGGVSAHEMQENDRVGIKTSDEGAWINDGDGQRVRWAQDDFSKIPIFKIPARLSRI